jgi:hypothetical protein
MAGEGGLWLRRARHALPALQRDGVDSPKMPPGFVEDENR